MKFMRATLTFGILCAALAQASAFHIDIISVGTVTSGANVTFTENVIFQNTSIVMPAFTTDTYSIVNNVPPQPGNGIFSNGSGDSMLFNLILNNVSANGPGVAGDGSWTYTGGTGAYVNLVGGGTFTFNLNTVTLASNSTFIGELTPVPEPATMAAVGLGAAALLRRRRKS